MYDAYDGQNGAMLAWLLEYFGRTDVHVLNIFFNRWVAEGREVFYRPVVPVAREFTLRVNSKIRATLDDIHADPGLKLIDFRSREEYIGKVDTEGRPGHIPGAVHIAWQDLLGKQEVLVPNETAERLLRAAGLKRGDRIVGYCRTGPRAALGYLALQRSGYDIRLYDRSYAEWARSGLPVEV